MLIIVCTAGCGETSPPEIPDLSKAAGTIIVEEDYFNAYIVMAVDYLYENYGLLGYDIDSELTHDIGYGDQGTIFQRGEEGKTMCVAAVMEVILTACELYAQETGDHAPYDFLPKQSWENLGDNDIKAHIWVDHALNAYGTADALINFGMGEAIPFEALIPGSFININRTTGTGHAVVFISFVDMNGIEYERYPENTPIIGFKYFSSQGGSAPGEGGFDYRYAIFSVFHESAFCNLHSGVCDEKGIPVMPYKRDIHVIYSTNPHYFNTGMMLHPDGWHHTPSHNQY